MRWARCSTSSTVSPRSRIARERLEHDVDDRRREAEGRLVEQQQVRRRDERAGDRELLLLPAGERARGPAPELLHDREQLVDGGDVRLGALAAPAAREAELEVLLDAELGEDAASLGNERDAALGDALRARGHGATARTAGSPLPRAGTSPMIACSVVDLPAPFGPIRPTISPRRTSSDRSRTAATPP